MGFSMRVSTFDRFHQAGVCRWASYTALYYKPVRLWPLWFMGNPTRGCLFRPLKAIV